MPRRGRRGSSTIVSACIGYDLRGGDLFTASLLELRPTIAISYNAGLHPDVIASRARDTKTIRAVETR